jgi:hypothetical protein
MQPPRKYPFRIYFWLVRDELTGKVRKTRHRMTDEEAESRFSGAVRIEDDSMLIEEPAASARIGSRNDQDRSGGRENS